MTTLTGAETEFLPLDKARNSMERPADVWFMLIVGLLMTLGVTMVYSASVNVYGQPLDWNRWWNTPLRQAAYAAVGLVAMLFAAGVSSRFWSWHGSLGRMPVVFLTGVALMLLVLMLIPDIGIRALGARRALQLPGGLLNLTFQPAELAKVVIVIWLSAALTRDAAAARTPTWRGFAWTIAPAGALIVLTVVEDFGTAALMGLVTVVLLYVGAARWRHMVSLMTAGGVLGVVFILLKPHRIERILTFLSTSPDPQREGYHIKQSMLAIGAGGWWGRGLGNGVRKYGYIPHDENDFIFSIICEELGVIGGIVVIALFLALLWRGFLIATRSDNPFGRLLAIGLTLTIALQAAMNIAVVTDLVPTKGISLPFVSAGGSGLLCLGIAAGLIAAVGRGVRSAADSVQEKPGGHG